MTLTTTTSNELQTITVIPFCTIEGHTSENCQCDSVVLSLPPVLRRPRLTRTIGLGSSFRDRLPEIFHRTPLNFPLPPLPSGCVLEGHTENTCDCEW